MAAVINGTAGRYLSLASNRPAYNSYSVCGWAVIDVDTNFLASIFTAWDGDPFSYEAIGTEENGVGIISIADSLSSSMGVSATVGTWFWFALRRNSAGNLKFWYSTVGGSFTTTTGTSATNSFDFFGFGDNSFSEPINGRFAALKCFDGTMTDTEIQSERDCILPRTISKRHAAWPCLGNATEMLVDISGNGYNLTNVNGVTADTSLPPVPWRLHGPNLMGVG